MKKQNYGGIGVLLLCVVLAMAACTQSPFINSERTMPGKWLVEDIEYLGHDGWAYLPFDTGDMLDFADNGRFTVTGSDDYRTGIGGQTRSRNILTFIFGSTERMRLRRHVLRRFRAEESYGRFILNIGMSIQRVIPFTK